MLSDTFYITHIVVYIVHKSRSYRGKGSNSCIYTSMRFWLQKFLQDLSNNNSFIHIKHTVSLRICRYLIFSWCGNDTEILHWLDEQYFQSRINFGNLLAFFLPMSTNVPLSVEFLQFFISADELQANVLKLAISRKWWHMFPRFLVWWKHFGWQKLLQISK